MPKINSGFKRRILDVCPDIDEHKAGRLAKKIAYRAAAMQEQFDFFESCRILGILPDITARDAIRNLEKEVAA